MTRVRCSSTPRAETLVKPPGSMRVTMASSTPSPPQRSTRAFWPAASRTASVDSTSTSISSCAGSPTSSRGWPIATAVLLSTGRLSTKPATGAVTGRTLPRPAWPSCASEACATCRRRAAICSSARAVDSSAPAVATWARAWSSCDAVTMPCSRSCCSRRSSPCATASVVVTAATRWRAALRALWPVLTSASAWLRERGSNRALPVGSISATTWRACTASPGCSLMRRTTPASGAVIT